MVGGSGRAHESIAFSEDHRWLAFVCREKGVRLWSTESWTELPLTEAASSFRSPALLRFSPDSRFLVVATIEERRKGAYVIDVTTGERWMMLEFDAKLALSAAFTADGKRLALGVNDGIRIWDVGERNETPIVVKGSLSMVSGIDLSPDGKTVASCGDSRVKLYDTVDGNELMTLHRADDKAHHAMFSEDGWALATFTVDGEVRFWHAPTFADNEASR